MSTPQTRSKTRKTPKTRRPRWRPFPALKPGLYTADLVLAALIEFIKADRRRLYMGDWVSTYRGKPGSRFDEHAQQLLKRPEKMPPCGTVACAAGHLAILTRTVGQTHVGSLMGLHALNIPAYNGLPGIEHLSGELRSLFQSGSSKPHQVLRELRRIRQQHADTLRKIVVTVQDRPLPAEFKYR